MPCSPRIDAGSANVRSFGEVSPSDLQSAAVIVRLPRLTRGATRVRRKGGLPPVGEAAQVGGLLLTLELVVSVGVARLVGVSAGAVVAGDFRAGLVGRLRALLSVGTGVGRGLVA